jgi:hypothetical protein
MRYFGTGLLVAAVTLPALAQAPKFIKVEVISKSGHLAKLNKNASKKDEAETIQLRVPISLAKGLLEKMEGEEIKVNGKDKKGIKAEELIDLLNNYKAGDLLLEIKTNAGDLVKITLE